MARIAPVRPGTRLMQWRPRGPPHATGPKLATGPDLRLDFLGNLPVRKAPDVAKPTGAHGQDDGLERQRLKVLQQTGLLRPDAMPELDAICARAKEQFGVGIALVTLIAADELIAKARAGIDLDRAPRQGQFCDHTIRSNAVLVVENAAEDPRFASNPVVAGPPFVRFYAGAPLIYLRNIRLGALCLLDGAPREFALGDRAELANMADEVVSVIMGYEFKDLLPFPTGPKS